eukprot:TRINITY_DN174_c3_g1_i1.p1 TRINITY_DN174_c3_g1~~TRINITY_DN174_c3_g1_i1.p1  ORF type:complete len:460 (+),score=147.08 TRINITY_DN174_c3_g1_i1:169-1380(+)
MEATEAVVELAEALRRSVNLRVSEGESSSSSESSDSESGRITPTPLPLERPLPRKVALITGITGQDGSYLADFLLSKNYIVHGIIRRASTFNTGRIEHLYHDVHVSGLPMELHYGDLTDSSCLVSVLNKTRPQEIYNLAAQSHVKVSFELADYTAQTSGVGTLRILDAIRICDLSDTVRFYQASTSELYGGMGPIPYSETTPFYPRSPYAVAKLYAYWITVNYREAFGMHASNGILFNHESPRRGPNFVTRKITRAVARIKKGLQDCLYLGNLEAYRDWGHAKEYVEAMWIMLQQEKPDDYVIATGEMHTVREFCEKAFGFAGIPLKWEGEGVNEVGVLEGTSHVAIRIDPRYYRPTEVDQLLGDASKAKRVLDWSPKITFHDLVQEMVTEDLKLLERGDLIS